VLSTVELLALEFRDKGSNLDLHVQSVASCRLDDPGSVCCVCLVRANADDVVQATRLRFDPGSNASRLRDRRRPSYVEAFWSPSPSAFRKNAQAKANADIPALIQARRAEESFSLRRGLDSF
jgi:hypothetical protein